MSSPSPIGIAAISYLVPDLTKDLDELFREGKLTSSPDVLREFGFRDCRISSASSTELASLVVKELLASAEIPPERIDLLVHATALPTSSLVMAPRDWSFAGSDTVHLDLFKYSVTKLQDDLGLFNARTIGVAELSCVALLNAVWLAQAVMEQEGLETAICVNADVFPPFAKREVLYNVISDSACAVLLERGVNRNRLIAYRQMTKGFYWDCEGRQNELIASYFPTAKRLILNTLGYARLALSDLSLIVPHNVSVRSWEILSRLLGVPRENIYLNNIEKKGHSIAADNFINLKDALDERRVQPGDTVLLFSFGLGAHWGCALLAI